MKKITLLSIIFTLILFLFPGCTQTGTEPEAANYSGQVRCVQTDGIILYIPDIGYVYVKTDFQVNPLKTVVLAFDSSDLISATGTFQDYFGQEMAYSYILEAYKSIRLADSSAGEPTFG